MISLIFTSDDTLVTGSRCGFSPVMDGRAESGWMVWTPVPGMLKLILSKPAWLLAGIEPGKRVGSDD